VSVDRPESDCSNELLPRPLARVLEALHSTGDDPRSRHAAAFASLEAITRWQGILLLTARSRMRLPVDRLKRVQNFMKRPSFGSWVEVLLRHGSREIDMLSSGAGALGVLEDLRELLCTPRLEHGQLVREIAGRGSGKELAWKDAIEHLPPYRNDFIGHAGFLADDHYQKVAPLFEASTVALMEQLAQLDQQLFVSSLEEEGVALSLSGVSGSSTSPVIDDPDLDPGECYLARSSGEMLVMLPEMLHFHDGNAYLFDRTPRERRTEFLDFASGERTRRDGSALLDSIFTENLSIEATDGSSAEVVTGRLSVRGEAVRSEISMGEILWIRVVLSNRSPVATSCRLSLPEATGWNWVNPDFKEYQVDPGDHRVWLVGAEPLHPGTIAPPMVETIASFDPKPIPVEPEGPIRIRAADPLPLVEREDLVADMATHLDPLQRPGATVVIGGAEGQRTGALLAALAASKRLQGVRDLHGTFRGAAGQPYKGFHDLLRDLLGVSFIETDAADVREHASQVLEELLGEDAAAITFFLEELSGEGSLEQTSDQMRSYWWYRLVTSAAREAPLLIAIDDLEQADAQSARLLSGLIARCVQDRAGVLFAVCSLREEQKSTDRPEGFGSEIPVLVVDVPATERTSVERMLDLAYPGAPHLDDLPWLAAVLAERAAGNIGFAIDLVRTLGPTGHGIFDPVAEGKWQLKEPLPASEHFSEQLPARRSDLYEEAIGRFSEDQAQILETAALIEGDIPVEVLERLFDDADLLDDTLDRFETDGLGEAVGTDLTHYRFRTEPARAAVLSIFEGRGRRAALRRRRELARVLIELEGEVPERAGPIGRLLRDAGQGQEALPHLLRALSRRESQGRYVEGRQLVEEIDAVLEGGATLEASELGQYLISAARVCIKLGDQDACEKYLEQVDAAQEEVHLQRQLLLAQISDRRGDAHGSLAILEQLRGAVEQSGASELAQHFQILLALGLQKQGRGPEAVAEYQRGIAIAEEREDELWEARILGNLGNLYTRIDPFGEIDTAQDCFEKAIEIFHQFGHLDMETICRVGLANVGFFHGKLEDAAQMYRQAIETFRLLQNRRGLGRNYRNLAEVEVLLGRFDVAVDALQRSVEVRQAIGDLGGVTRCHLDLVEIHAVMGDWQEASRANDQALKVAKEIGDELLLREGRIRHEMNRLSTGEDPRSIDLLSLKEEVESEQERDPDLDALWYTLRARHTHLLGNNLEEEEIDQGQQLISKLGGLAFSRKRCLLCASIAVVCSDRDRALALLMPRLEETDLPLGAPLDMVLSARASLEAEGSKEREVWEERAMEAVEERANRIERSVDRRRFLRARLGRIDEE